MSFGKRRAEEPARPQPVRPQAPLAPRRAGGTGGSGPIKMAMGFIAGLVLIAGIYHNYTSSMRELGRQLDKSFDTVQVNPAPALNLLKVEGADGWDLGSCTMVKPPSLADRFMPKPHGAGDSLDLKIREAMGGENADGFTHTANFLDCVARSESRRMCTPAVRSAFVNDALAFYRSYKIAGTFSIAGNTQRALNPEFADVMKTLENANAEIGAAQDSVASEYEEAKDTVDGAIISAAQGGYVSKGDFGFFAPGAVTALFKDIDAPSNPCQPQN
jgi:hypothetical protein